MGDDDGCTVAVGCVGLRMVEVTSKFQVVGEKRDVGNHDECTCL